MTATVGFQLRLPPDVYAALDREIGRGAKNAHIIELIRRDLIRRGALPKPAHNPRPKGKPR